MEPSKALASAYGACCAAIPGVGAGMTLCHPATTTNVPLANQIYG